MDGVNEYDEIHTYFSNIYRRKRSEYRNISIFFHDEEHAMAMSDLTDTQINDLKAHLVKWSRELKQEIREALSQSDEQHHKDLAGSVADLGDEAVADMLTDVDAALIDRHVVELRDVESALQRMRDGIFGVCIDCGADIGYDRLTVYLTAKRCIRCQQRHEQTYFRGATPTL